MDYDQVNIEEIKNKINNGIYIYWNEITRKKLPEDFIREFQDKLDWFWVSQKSILSENFIREFQDKVNWIYISIIQKLSEDFIREFQNKVYWSTISITQKLSRDFIIEFYDLLLLGEIEKRKLIDEEILNSLIIMKKLVENNGR